jgi:hypothetical protein
LKYYVVGFEKQVLHIANKLKDVYWNYFKNKNITAVV